MGTCGPGRPVSWRCPCPRSLALTEKKTPGNRLRGAEKDTFTSCNNAIQQATLANFTVHKKEPDHRARCRKRKAAGLDAVGHLAACNEDRKAKLRRLIDDVDCERRNWFAFPAHRNAHRHLQPLSPHTRRGHRTMHRASKDELRRIGCCGL